MTKLNDNKIDETEFYEIIDEAYMCCDEHQFKYYCKKCYEFMGCQFCQFDPYSECECAE